MGIGGFLQRLEEGGCEDWPKTSRSYPREGVLALHDSLKAVNVHRDTIREHWSLRRVIYCLGVLLPAHNAVAHT